jgi:hypothetical protein
MVERKFRLPRIWSNRELEKIAPLFSGAVVNVSGWKDEDKEGNNYKDYFTGATSYTVTNYGGFRGFQGSDREILLDLTHQLPSELCDKFDVVFNHTTLEHIFDIRMAFKNLCLMSKDIVIVVVPFAQTQHEHENVRDFWRFTPTCMRYLFQENGMGIIYESANQHSNAGIYITAVGSKNPRAWAGKMPPYAQVHDAAWRLGASWKEKLKRLVKQ